MGHAGTKDPRAHSRRCGRARALPLLMHAAAKSLMLARVHANQFCHCHLPGLLVGHAGMEDPVRTFQALWAGAALPPLMRAGVMESRLLLHHLLLHDDSGHAEGGYQR